MKSAKKSRRPAINIRRTYKTKDDFLRWLTAKKLLRKQAAEEQKAQTNRTTAEALMVLDDDGGPAT